MLLGYLGYGIRVESRETIKGTCVSVYRLKKALGYFCLPATRNNFPMFSQKWYEYFDK